MKSKDKANNVGWKFDNSYSRLPRQLFSETCPITVTNPSLVILNEIFSTAIGLNFKKLNTHEIAQILSGNILPEGTHPIAQAYAGDQFGNFTMLGDGRAVLLGEHLTPNNHRIDIQLKGSGKTPYSRGGDGRASLGPMLREYIMSESMHALGIPTTRSLAVIDSGELVYRETPLKGAILVRAAASHIRIGTFQYAAIQEDVSILGELLHYTIARHYPHLTAVENPALELLKAVTQSQAHLISEWTRVGFIHGVMNTDNMAISGETIDYGPCAYMDEYHTNTVFSSIDRQGRYAFGNQPKIAQWNLARFAETLLPFINPKIEKAIEIAEEVIYSFQTVYLAYWTEVMRKKLGLIGEEEKGDSDLITQLLSLMQANQMDYTNTFLNLAETLINNPGYKQFKYPPFQGWLDLWQLRLKQNDQPLDASIALMKMNNPAVIPRNHNIAFALQAATEHDDIEPTRQLLNVLEKPYDLTSEFKSYQNPPSDCERVQQTFCGT